MTTKQLVLFPELGAGDTTRNAARTPDWLYRQLDEEFRFTIDAAADKTNTKCPHYFGLDNGLNALEVDWVEYARDMKLEPSFWHNPPYSFPEIEYHMHKAHEAFRNGGTVANLIRPSLCSEWWHKYVLQGGEQRPIKGRVNFIPPPGIEYTGNDTDSALVIFSGWDKIYEKQMIFDELVRLINRLSMASKQNDPTEIMHEYKKVKGWLNKVAALSPGIVKIGLADHYEEPPKLCGADSTKRATTKSKPPAQARSETTSTSKGVRKRSKTT